MDVFISIRNKLQLWVYHGKSYLESRTFRCKCVDFFCFLLIGLNDYFAYGQQILREYGGIYLDNDCLVVNDITNLRRHHCVMVMDSEERSLGMQSYYSVEQEAQYLCIHVGLSIKLAESLRFEWGIKKYHRIQHDQEVTCRFQLSKKPNH